MLRVLIIIMMSFHLTAHGQNGHFEFGANASATANALIASQSDWALFHNIGALGEVQTPKIACGFRVPQLSPFLGTSAISLQYPTSFFNVGLGYFRFGDELFSQQNLKFAIANSFQNVSLGLGINFVQTHIDGYGVIRQPVFEMGGITRLGKSLNLSAHIYNISTGNDLPSFLKFAFNFQATENLLLGSAIKKELNQDASFAFGLDYQLTENVSLRLGTSTAAVKLCGGIGWAMKAFKIDYAFVHNTALLSQHEVAFIYILSK